MDPCTIHDSQFTIIRPLIYHSDGFTAAFGLWERQHHCVAMRWDGEGDAPGFPLGRGGRAKWLALPKELTRPVLCSLLAAPMPGISVPAIAQALGVLDAETAGSPVVGLLDEQVVASERFEQRREAAQRVERDAIEAMSASAKPSFYIYENWQAGSHKAVIHRSDCPYCNNGKG